MRSLLTIAGSDSCGGAGLQADLKTFAAHGWYGQSVVTAVTAQSRAGVRRCDPVAIDLFRAQLLAVRDDLSVAAIKIGMLGTVEHVHVVGQVLADWPGRPPVVLDPVIRSSSGAALLDGPGVTALATLLSQVTVVTPNLREARVLSGSTPLDEWAASLDCGVLVTGGDVGGPRVRDVLFHQGAQRCWEGPRTPGPSPHGTGCTLSAAIAARLADGAELAQAVGHAIGAVRRLVAVSKGSGLLEHHRRDWVSGEG